MWQWTHSQRVGGSKREHAGKHLVQRDAQRVEIAPGINRAVHAPGLFRGHVGQCAGNDLGRRGRLALVRQSGRDAKAGEPHVTGVVDERVLRLDVFMDQTAPVGMAERRRQANGKAQKARQIERLLRCSRSRTPSSGSPPGSVRTRTVRPS